MDCMEALRERRTQRKFEMMDLPEQALADILDAARWAQSWANTQCWEVIAVRDKGVKMELQHTVSPSNPSYDAIVQAPVVLALCAKKGVSGYYKGGPATPLGDWMLFDLGILTQNIALAACALGMGSVVVGLYDHEQAAAVLKVPEEYAQVSLMPLGFPVKKAVKPPRRERSDFVHKDRF